MKISSILMLLILAIMAACHNKSDKFISGTYVHRAQSEYSVAYDTLIVQSIISGQTYQLELRTGFQRIDGHRLLHKEFKIIRWQATWNAKTRILSETDYGRQLILLPDNKTFQLKTSKFTRL